ncbi:MAG: PilZ domain-containing protein [Acidobacteriota bacterium]|nr:PilZ domain-containing protein [Acidobacteriota bacterium]
MDERRQTKRSKISLDASWEGILGRFEGSIADISRDGCFLLTSDRVQPGELIRLEIKLPGAGELYLWAEVVYQVREIGFALRFTSTETGEGDTLERLLNYMSRKEAV